MAIKAVFIDLSGTLHIEDKVVPGAIEALNRLQEHNISVRFVTNTTKESTNLLYERLTRLGFTTITRDSIHSSLKAARNLVEKRNLVPFLMVSSEALEEFEGLPQLSDNVNSAFSEENACVLIGLAPEHFNYDKLNIAFSYLKKGAKLIAIHAGKYYQTSTGLSLGPGCFVKGLEYSAQCTAEIVGKPSELFFRTVLEDANVGAEDTVMIGDDVTDDIQGAQNIGMSGFLVKTGKYRNGDESKITKPPAGVFDSVVEAIDEIIRINTK